MSALVLCDDSNGRALIDRAIRYGIKGFLTAPENLRETMQS